MSPAGLLERAAPNLPTKLLRRRGSTLLVSLQVLRPGGQSIPFVLEIEAGNREPKVREQSPTQLPSFCPERHINAGGWFCLNFPQAEPLNVHDADTADEWWRRVWKFLTHQFSAARLRRWPTNTAWAHGTAATYQERAEACAAELGLERALRAGDLKIIRRRGSRFLGVHEGKRRRYSTWIVDKRVATLRQPCLCGSGRVLRSCGDHAKRAVELAFAIEAWRKEEAAFWLSMKGRTCCGTMDNCPIAAGTTAGLANDDAAAQAA